MVIKITMKKRNKRDENEGEPGSRKGKCFGVNMGIYIIGQGWMGERGSSGGDRAGGVVGVVVSKEQSLRGDFHQC